MELGTKKDIKSAFKTHNMDGYGYISKDEMFTAISWMGFVENKDEEPSKCLKEILMVTEEFHMQNSWSNGGSHSHSLFNNFPKLLMQESIKINV